MEPDFVNKIVIVRCHRFGSSFTGGINASFLRPMIVRFLNFNDRQAVWMKRFDLTNKSISIDLFLVSSKGQSSIDQKTSGFMKTTKNSFVFC